MFAVELSIYTDGGSKGNPGPSAIGIAFIQGSSVIYTYREDIGEATNNTAEYRALLKAYELMKYNSGLHNKIKGATTINFYSDSLLMVEQLKGNYKVKQDHIQDFVSRVRVYEAELVSNGVNATYTYIAREKNKIADALVNDKYLETSTGSQHQ